MSNGNYTIGRRKRQPKDEVKRVLRIARLVAELDEAHALTPRRVARQLGFYETSTRVDLAWLASTDFVKTKELPKHGGRHDRVYWGAP